MENVLNNKKNFNRALASPNRYKSFCYLRFTVFEVFCKHLDIIPFYFKKQTLFQALERLQTGLSGVNRKYPKFEMIVLCTIEECNNLIANIRRKAKLAKYNNTSYCTKRGKRDRAREKKL